MIPNAYLNELAVYTKDRISKVVINGSYEITTFTTRQVTASTVELVYTIPLNLSGQSVVQLIEIKSSSGSVISSNAVFIPIVSDTIMKHTISIKEA